MEIQVSKLLEVMELLRPAVPKNPTLSILKFVRLADGKAMATDLETMVIADLPQATEPMLLPFASILDMLKYVPGRDTMKITAEGKTLTLAWDGGSAKYPTESPADFPVLPELDVKAEGLIDGDQLVPALMSALPYAATEEDRPVLTGVLLVLGNPVEVVAADGFTISVQTLPLSFPLEEKVILPARSVKIMDHVFRKTPRTPPSGIETLVQAITAKRKVHLTLVGETKVRIDLGREASVVINRITGNYPGYLDLIPKEFSLSSQIFAPQLEAAVKRVRRICKGSSGIVRLVFADGKVTVSAQEKDVGEISATVDTINTQGEPNRIAVNFQYLLRYLEGKAGIVSFSMKERSSPMLFEYPGLPRVALMPMFVQWDDEKKPEAETTEPSAEVTEPEAETEETETTELEPEMEVGESSEEEIEPQEPVAAAATAEPPKRRGRTRKVKP